MLGRIGVSVLWKLEKHTIIYGVHVLECYDTSIVKLTNGSNSNLALIYIMVVQPFCFLSIRSISCVTSIVVTKRR